MTNTESAVEKSSLLKGAHVIVAETGGKHHIGAINAGRKLIANYLNKANAEMYTSDPLGDSHGHESKASPHLPTCLE